MRLRLSYRLAGRFKGLLFILAVVTIVAVFLYTGMIVGDLRQNSRRYVNLRVEQMKMLLLQGGNEKLDSYLHEMKTKDFPLIVTDSTRKALSFSGFPELDSLPLHIGLKKIEPYITEWVSQGNEPVLLEIPEYGLKFNYYYGDLDQIKKLRMMPYVEVIVVSFLILIGYLGFHSIRKSEERSVWVGMARETAHQLGTPLTSLYGWVELLSERPDDPAVRDEISKDLKRLQTVADRFNKIGSQLPLKPEPLQPVVEEAVAYIRRRLPQIGDSEVKLVVEDLPELDVKINHTLFEWALENLLKNGVEALGGKKGSVTLSVKKTGRKVHLDISDDGCGIHHRQWRNVFRPGFTTKERGWGLGLSLTRRIIEDVHHGRIFIVDSTPEKGTIIRVQLTV